MDAILNFLPYIGWVILALSILVFIHELGHFLAAKLFGMRVEQFSIGFPPKVIGKQIGETEYRIGAIPLGGYVKISGMVDESLDTAELASEPKPWEFRAKPVWQRIIVICAGVVFNIVLAIAIFIGLKYAFGEAFIPAEKVGALYIDEQGFAHQLGIRTGDRMVAINGQPVTRFGELMSVKTLSADRVTVTVERGDRQVTLQAPEDLFTQLTRNSDLGMYSRPYVLLAGVSPDSPADKAGLEPGDRVLSINGEPIRVVNELINRVEASKGSPVTLVIDREADTGRTEIEQELSARHSDGRYILGVSVETRDSLFMDPEVFEQQPYSFLEAIAEGTRATWDNTLLQVQGLKKIITGRENFRENVGGPVMIAKVTRQAAQQGWQSFWRIVAMLSIVLAIMNILPIPALDGGHLMFLLYEGITRREPSLKVRMVMQQIGMVLLLGLMAFLIFNDILRL